MGNEVVVMTRSGLTVIDSARDAFCPSPLLTRTVNPKVPGVLGVPLSVPAVLRFRFGGSEPEITDQA